MVSTLQIKRLVVVCVNSPRAPRVTKVNHKQPDHSNGSPSCGSLLVEVIDVARQDDRDNDVARSHANSADNEHRLTSDPVNIQNGRNSSNLIADMLVIPGEADDVGGSYKHHDTHNTSG